MQGFQISADSLNPMKKQKILRILRIKSLMNGEKKMIFRKLTSSLEFSQETALVLLARNLER